MRGVLSVSVRNISGMRRNWTTPERTVKYTPSRARMGSTSHVHSTSPPVSMSSLMKSIV
ncbi:hypothetical protein ACFPRL_13365 [Pseudoclavibacter helvolus]